MPTKPKCRVCECREYRDTIDSMLQAGYSGKYIEDVLKQSGIDNITHYHITSHGRYHLIKEVKNPLSDSLSDLDGLTIPTKDTDLNFEKYCLRLGIDLNNLTEDSLINASQQSLAEIFFKLACIVNFRIDKHIKYGEGLPSTMIRNLSTVYLMYSKVTGIETLIDENTALKTLTNIGYTVSKDAINNIESK